VTNINYTNLYNYIRVVFHYTRIIYLRANYPEPGSTRELGYMVEESGFLDYLDSTEQNMAHSQ